MLLKLEEDLNFNIAFGINLKIVSMPYFSNMCDPAMDVSIMVLPRSIRPGRKRPFLIVSDWFGSGRITTVFHHIVNERKRSDTPFSGRLRQLLTVYDTTKKRS